MSATKSPLGVTYRDRWEMHRDSLELERAELLGQIGASTTASATTATTATTGPGETEHIVSGIELGMQSALDAQSEERLVDVTDALRRLDSGTYGLCETCGRDIAMDRLDAMPHARLCVACQRRQETDRRLRR